MLQLIYINLNFQVGGVAQMVERLPACEEAMGSMPIISTFLCPAAKEWVLFLN